MSRATLLGLTLIGAALGATALGLALRPADLPDVGARTRRNVTPSEATTTTDASGLLLLRGVVVQPDGAAVAGPVELSGCVDPRWIGEDGSFEVFARPRGRCRLVGHSRNPARVGALDIEDPIPGELLRLELRAMQPRPQP